MPVGHIQLPIDEHGHSRLDAAGTLSVRRNQSVNRSVDERPFGVAEEDGQIFRLRIRGFAGPRRRDALRHGYRGGLEMAATVDSLFGFSATAGIVTDWMFEGIAESFANGDAQRFLQRDNPWARENGLVDRFVVMHSGNVGHAQNLEGLVRAATFLRDLDDLEIIGMSFVERTDAVCQDRGPDPPSLVGWGAQ